MATLTCVSLTAGLATAWVGVSVARGLWPPDTFRVDAIPLQPPVLVFAAVVAGLLIVLGPAVPALRWIPGSLDMGRATGGSRHMRTRLTLLAAQLATVLALLGSSVILLRGLGTTSATDRGIDIDGLLIGRVDLPQERYPTGMARYPEWPEVHRFHAALLEQLAREGEVRSVALAGSDPLSRPGFRMGVGLRTRDRADTVEAALQMVSPEWRSVVGLRLLAGRDLSARDGRAAEPVALVNDAFRRAYLSAADDWSGRITYLGAERRIVGVIEDVKPAPGAAPVATVLAPLAQTPSEMVTAVVRTRGVPATAVGVIRDAVYSVDPQLAVYAERPLASVLRESFTRPRLHGALVTAFGSAGLLLVAMGLFGLVSQIVSATRTSLGIRIALGAGRLHVVRAVLKGVSPPVLVGLVVGASGAAAAAPWVARLVPDTPAIDLVGLAAAVGVLLAAGALATLPPLLAALRTDPMRSLRPD